MRVSYQHKFRDLSKERDIKILLRSLKVNTVCERALCPNISECFSAGVATFLILGEGCTRNCKFCGVKKGEYLDVDLDEPKRVCEVVKRLKLRYVVITSPTRDDLPDRGVGVYSRTIRLLKGLDNVKAIEALIPDFDGDKDLIASLLSSGIDVLSHNIETVPSLYREVRPDFDYSRSLNVLRIAKSLRKDIILKSGIILGLGETIEDVTGVLKDLRKIGCDIITLGQYFPPSKDSYPVKKYLSIEEFNHIKDIAVRIGFLCVVSGPYVRSSYLSHKYMERFLLKNN